MLKHSLLLAASFVMSASLAHAAGQTSVSNVNQNFEMNGNAKIQAIPNEAKASGGGKFINAEAEASYEGGVKANIIEVGKGTTLRNVNQNVKMGGNSEVMGASVHVNSIKAGK